MEPVEKKILLKQFVEYYEKNKLFNPLNVSFELLIMKMIEDSNPGVLMVLKQKNTNSYWKWPGASVLPGHMIGAITQALRTYENKEFVEALKSLKMDIVKEKTTAERSNTTWDASPKALFRKSSPSYWGRTYDAFEKCFPDDYPEKLRVFLANLYSKAILSGLRSKINVDLKVPVEVIFEAKMVVVLNQDGFSQLYFPVFIDKVKSKAGEKPRMQYNFIEPDQMVGTFEAAGVDYLLKRAVPLLLPLLNKNAGEKKMRHYSFSMMPYM